MTTYEQGAPALLTGLLTAVAAVAQIVDASPQLCGDGDLLAALDAAVELTDRVGGITTGLVAEIDERGVPAETGCPNVTALLRHRHRMDQRTAKGLSDHAYAVRHCFATVGDGQRAGRASLEQAAAIVTVLDDLPWTATSEERTAAQTFLIGQCRSLSPRQLRAAGRSIIENLTLVSEDGPEPAESPTTDPHEQRSFVTLARDGGMAVRGFFPGAEGAALAAFLGARSGHDPAGHGDPTDPDVRDTRSLPQRQYDAVQDALTHAGRCAAVPAATVPQLIVGLSYEDLRAGLARATLVDLDQPLGPTEARLLACDANLIPTVLGSAGQPLDVGREQRLFTAAQHRALAGRDSGCSFPGCDRPPAGCHAHHLVPWFDGGRTCLTNGTLLCGYHHRLVHRQGWTARLDANGVPEFIPPAWIDLARQPRQHHRFILRR